MVKNQALNCHSGKQIPCEIDSVCIHGDNKSSLATAISIRNDLLDNGLKLVALNKMEASEITISNRTSKKAEDLKIQFNKINTVSWGEVPDFDMIINATSLGLNNETIDLNTSNIGEGKFFYDVIYNPNETNFLKLGKKLGHKTENGKLMFVYQAFEAFRLWHGVEPNVSEKILKLLDHD